jgi:hypothetical protein
VDGKLLESGFYFEDTKTIFTPLEDAAVAHAD